MTFNVQVFSHGELVQIYARPIPREAADNLLALVQIVVELVVLWRCAQMDIELARNPEGH